MKNKDFVLPHDYFQTKYGVGNYVRIRENLEVGKKYNGLLWLPQMDNYKGKIYKIKHSFYSSVYKRYFLENIDYEFSEEMLEEINPIKKNITRRYMKRILKKNIEKLDSSDVITTFFIPEVFISFLAVVLSLVSFIMALINYFN